MMTLRHTALALALAGATATVHAGVRASAVTLDSYWTGTADEAYLELTAAGAVTLTFNLPAAGRKVLTFSAVCAVHAPPLSEEAHLDLDIYVNGLRVAPTIGTNPTPDDGFCFHGYTPSGLGGFTRASITIPIQGKAGSNSVQIKARGQNGATGWFLSRRSLVIYD